MILVIIVRLPLLPICLFRWYYRKRISCRNLNVGLAVPSRFFLMKIHPHEYRVSPLRPLLSVLPACKRWYSWNTLIVASLWSIGQGPSTSKWIRWRLKLWRYFAAPIAESFQRMMCLSRDNVWTWNFVSFVVQWRSGLRVGPDWALEIGWHTATTWIANRSTVDHER